MNIDPSRKLEIETHADVFISKYGEAVIGRMIAYSAKDTSDAEIERTLAPCVCGNWLVTLARVMRDRNILVLSEQHNKKVRKTLNLA